MALRNQWSPVCLSVHYGQRHEKELLAAKKLAAHLKLEHWIIPLSLPWGGSALTDNQISVPKGRSEGEMTKEIPSTYVPARNSILLSLAASLAETKGAEAVYFGANALDYSGYPDCRPEFIEAFEEMIKRGTKTGTKHPIQVVAPLLRMTKAEIVKLGSQLKVPFEWTWSCYDGKEFPCGECDSCILRAKGFREAGIEDPLSLRAPRSGEKQSQVSGIASPLPVEGTVKGILISPEAGGVRASASLGTLPRNDGKRYA